MTCRPAKMEPEAIRDVVAGVRIIRKSKGYEIKLRHNSYQQKQDCPR